MLAPSSNFLEPDALTRMRQKALCGVVRMSEYCKHGSNLGIGIEKRAHKLHAK